MQTARRFSKAVTVIAPISPCLPLCLPAWPPHLPSPLMPAEDPPALSMIFRLTRSTTLSLGAVGPALGLAADGREPWDLLPRKDKQTDRPRPADEHQPDNKRRIAPAGRPATQEAYLAADMGLPSCPADRRREDEAAGV